MALGPPTKADGWICLSPQGFGLRCAHDADSAWRRWSGAYHFAPKRVSRAGETTWQEDGRSRLNDRAPCRRRERPLGACRKPDGGSPRQPDPWSTRKTGLAEEVREVTGGDLIQKSKTGLVWLPVPARNASEGIRVHRRIELAAELRGDGRHPRSRFRVSLTAVAILRFQRPRYVVLSPHCVDHSWPLTSSGGA